MCRKLLNQYTLRIKRNYYGRTFTESVLFTGAEQDSYLQGYKEYNKGLIIQIDKRQKKGEKSNHLEGNIKIIKIGTGDYKEVFENFQKKYKSNFFSAESLSNKIKETSNKKRVYALYTGSLELCREPLEKIFNLYPDDIDGNKYEGASKKVYVNSYERNPGLRQQCIDEFGYRCSVCEVSLDQIYGKIGEGFIHVHHKTPLHVIKKSHQIDPIKDLCPVCPNCHSMLHRSDPPLTIEELKEIVKTQRENNNDT